MDLQRSWRFPRFLLDSRKRELGMCGIHETSFAAWCIRAFLDFCDRQSDCEFAIGLIPWKRIRSQMHSQDLGPDMDRFRSGHGRTRGVPGRKTAKKFSSCWCFTTLWPQNPVWGRFWAHRIPNYFYRTFRSEDTFPRLNPKKFRKTEKSWYGFTKFLRISQISVGSWGTWTGEARGSQK